LFDCCFVFEDYDQDGNIIQWQGEKQVGKRKKKSEQSAQVETTGDGTTTNTQIRDVHKFIFDDEAVIVDDCSFVLPYIESGYYYPPATPTDLPLNATNEFIPPITPVYTEEQLKELLRRQVYNDRFLLFKHWIVFCLSSEYYFSNENLEVDVFLRQQMSNEGYVPLSLIASFHRVRSLCDNVYTIANVCTFEKEKQTNKKKNYFPYLGYSR